MTRRWALGVLATAVAVALVGCDGSPSSASYRFRMTVEVATPQGVRAGSAVYEVASVKGVRVGDQGGGGTRLRGESVVIDLPDGPVFALLNNGNAAETLAGMATEAFAAAAGVKLVDFDDFVKMVASLGSRWTAARTDLPRRHNIGVALRSDGADDSNWPLFVRFGDINDPKSVERVEPESIGVKRIVLETTRDAVTTGIDKRLGWLNHLERYRSNPSNVFTSTLPNEIGGLRSQ
jgi:hypothetical protein